MKRASSLLSGLLVAGSLAWAPSSLWAQMTLGLGGGVVAATFTGDDADDFASGASKGTRVGISVGAHLAVPIAERFSIVPGAYYVQKGAKYSASGFTGTFEANYIEIPVLVSAMLTGPESSLGFNLFAGPTFAFEAGCNISAEGGGSSGSTSCDNAGATDRQSFDIGLAGGAGVSFPITETLSLLISAGYELGMRTLDASDDPGDIKNSAFFGDVHILIPIGG